MWYWGSVKSIRWIENQTSRDDQHVRQLVTYVPHVVLCSYMCVFSVNEVLIWVIIVFVRSVSCFMKFEGQTSKNVHDVRKVCLKTTLCFLARFVKFYGFVFMKLIWEVLNSYTNISSCKCLGKSPQEPSNGPWERTLPRAKGCQDQPQLTEANDGSLAIQSPVDGIRSSRLSLGRSRSLLTVLVPNNGQTRRSVCGQTVRLWPSRLGGYLGVF